MDSNVGKPTLLIGWINNFHSGIETMSFGLIKMDELQVQIFHNLPKFEKDMFFKLTAFSMAFFFIMFLILHYVLIKGFMEYFKQTKWAQKYLTLNKYDSFTFTSYIHSMVHAGIVVIAGIYGFLYANGEPNSVYFYNEEYQSKMFDI